jgi:hypothetical protein
MLTNHPESEMVLLSPSLAKELLECAQANDSFDDLDVPAIARRVIEMFCATTRAQSDVSMLTMPAILCRLINQLAEHARNESVTRREFAFAALVSLLRGMGVSDDRLKIGKYLSDNVGEYPLGLAHAGWRLSWKGWGRRRRYIIEEIAGRDALERRARVVDACSEESAKALARAFPQPIIDYLVIEFLQDASRLGVLDSFVYLEAERSERIARELAEGGRN